MANALQQTTVLAFNGGRAIDYCYSTLTSGSHSLQLHGCRSHICDRSTRKHDSVAVDGLGRIQSKTLPLGQTTNYQYDSNSRLSQSQDPLGAVTAFGYDPNGNLTSVTDALSNATGYTYDSRNQRIARTDPLRHSEHRDSIQMATWFRSQIERGKSPPTRTMRSIGFSRCSTPISPQLRIHTTLVIV